MRQTQRRIRNKEEREEIRNSTLDGFVRMQIEDHVNIIKLIAILDEFVACDGSARQFDGNFEIPERSIIIEYMLPGKRIIPHYVRVSTIKESE